MPEPGDATRPDFSVLIPTRQRRRLLASALRGLERQTMEGASFEVIVAVDGSTDGTRQMLASWTAPYRLRYLELAGVGRGAAVNAALARASGDIVLILDDDMEPAPGLLAAHRQALERAGRAGVVGAAPLEVRQDAALAERYVAERFNRHLRKLAASAEEVGPADFYSGNFAICRSDLAAVGGFDTDYVAYGNEDRDLAVRLKASGVRLVFESRASAVQRCTKSAAELVDDHFAKGRTAVLFSTRHPGPFAETPFRSYRGGPLPRKVARRMILGLGAAWPGLDRRAGAVGGLLERHPPPGAAHLLALLLDYAFWRGVAAASRSPGVRR